jgi:hypothetical protein
MANLTDAYWQKRLTNVEIALGANKFDVYQAANAEEAKKITLERIMPPLNVESVSWGGSMTLISTGIDQTLRGDKNLKILDTQNRSMPFEEMWELRRQSLLVDLYLTGTNAVTEEGTLVNLDMYGNRVAAITFGPKYVVVFAGRNKIVSDLSDAMFRIKNYAAPVNAMRLDKKTPCVQSSYCEDCKSDNRICNIWTINEKSFPKGRIKIVLINEDLGF